MNPLRAFRWPTQAFKGWHCLLAVMVLFTAQFAQSESLRKVGVSQWGKERLFLYLPFYVAMEEGYFRKRGIEIELHFAGNDDQIFASVMSGDSWFGIGDPVFAAISREKGGPGRIIAMMITKLPLGGVTNRDSVPSITKADDLRGLRVSSFPAPSTTYILLKELIEMHGLASTGTRIVPIAFGAELAALEAGQVDIAVSLEPSVSVAESKGYRVNFSMDRFSTTQAITGISTVDSVLEQHPETCQAIVSGLQEALTALYRDPAIGIRVGEKLFPTLTKEIIQRAVTRSLQAEVFSRSVVVADEYWQRTLATRIASGDLKKPQATSFTVDNRFANRAGHEEGSGR